MDAKVMCCSISVLFFIYTLDWVAMESWKIVIFVVMCITTTVLVVVIFLYIIACIRDHRRVELFSMKSFSNVLRKKSDILNELSIKDNHTLYFTDLNSRICSVDLVEKNVWDGTGLRQIIAKTCHINHPETLSLAYSGPSVLVTNPNGTELLVPADLDLLVARNEEFSNRMAYTKEYPLTLHRRAHSWLSEGDESARCKDVACNMIKKCEERVHNDTANSLPRLQGDEEANANRFSQPQYLSDLLPTTVVADAGQEDEFDDPDLSTTLLSFRLRIYPSDTKHITDKTPIFILCANYYVFYVNRTFELIHDEETTNALEAAMCGERENYSILMSSGPYEGGTFLVNPEDGNAILRKPGMADARVVRNAAKKVQYCVNPPSNSQWAEFYRPIFLSPGRWCIQARACSSQDKFSLTTATVYTVSLSE